MDGLASRSLYLSVLAAQFPDLLSSDKAQAMLADILAVAAERRYVTVSAAQAARALMVYSRGLAPDLSGAAITALDAEGRTLELALTEGDRMRSVSLESGADGDSPRCLGRPRWPSVLRLPGLLAGGKRGVRTASLPPGPWTRAWPWPSSCDGPTARPPSTSTAGDELVLVVRARA